MGWIEVDLLNGPIVAQPGVAGQLGFSAPSLYKLAPTSTEIQELRADLFVLKVDPLSSIWAR